MDGASSRVLFAFDQFELDVAVCELRRNGRLVPLQPRVFDLLRYLVENRDRVVSQKELIDALWAGQQLNAVAVPWSISHARRALGEHGRRRFIETIRGHGYRFIAPVRSSHVQGEDAGGSVPPLAIPETPPFVGRADVMRQLAAALEGARSGRGRLYLLTGEPGIGKTRCAEELERLARSDHAQVWKARCPSSGGAPSFWPFIQLLRAAAKVPGTAAATKRRIAALLQRLVPGAALQGANEDQSLAELSDSARFWLLDELLGCLRIAGERQPVLLVLDDLQNADDGSIEALSLLSPELERMRMLVVATVRSVPGTAQDRATELSLRLRPCERIALTGLSLEDIARCLERFLAEPPHPELARAVHARTAGNPLYMHEVLRLLAALRGRGAAVDPDSIALPEAAKGFIEGRIAALPEATRRVLQAACVIGEEFPLSVLQRVVDEDAEVLLSLLDSALAAHVIEPRGHAGKQGFTHVLLREALYEALPLLERARLHARVGLALEALTAFQPRHGELAYHFQRALPEDHYERVARYSRLAAAAAMAVFAYDEAAKYYAWALAAQPHLADADDRSSCELLLLLAKALLGAGRRSEWRTHCEQALAIARRAGLSDLIVEAACLLRPSVFFARLPDRIAIEALEEALRALPQDAKASRSKALSRLACLPPYGNSVEASRRLTGEALRLAREVDQPALLLAALKARLHALSGPDSIDELLATADEILERQTTPATWIGAEAHLARYHALLRRADGGSADRALEAFGHIARRMRLPHALWHHDRLCALRCVYRGELTRAHRWFEELLEQSKQLRLPNGERFYRSQLSALQFERTGRWSIGDERDAPDPALRVLGSYRAEQIQLAIEAGDRPRAHAELLSMAEGAFAATRDDHSGFAAAIRLAWAAIALDERALAEQLYALLLPHAQLTAISAFAHSVGPVSHTLGQLTHYLGGDAAAVRHFEAALAASTTLGYATHAARARFAIADLLAPERATRDRARTLAAQVAEEAPRLEMTSLAEDAQRLLAQWV